MKKRNRYTLELLKPIIEKSKSWAEVCRFLEIRPMTGAQCHIKKKAEQFNIDFSHFLGRASNKGKKSGKRIDALKQCFNGNKIHSHKLKLLLIRDGYKKEECEICGIKEWNNLRLPLELHHKDSNHFNNEFNNLQILCPNCHAVETIKIRETDGMVDNSVLETGAK